MTNWVQFNRRVGGYLLCASTFLAIASCPARAVENGATITPFGVTDFGAGFSPPHTQYGTFGIRAANYSANTQRDGSGRKVDNNFEYDVQSIAFAYFYLTDFELFGGKYGFAAVVPFLNVNGNIDVPTPFGPLNLNNEDFDIGDMALLPFSLTWSLPPNWFVKTGLEIQIPTGAYDTQQAFNPGVNHWTISPQLAVTYISDTGLEISTQAMLSVNTENHATDYRSGIEYKQEFAIGQHIGPWTLGVGGYAYQQISDDKGPNITDGNRSRVFALGPSLSFLKPGLPVMTMHAYKEFGAENHTEGYNFALRVAVSF